MRDDDVNPFDSFCVQWAITTFVVILGCAILSVLFEGCVDFGDYVKRGLIFFITTGWILIPVVRAIILLESSLFEDWFVPLKNWVAARCFGLNKQTLRTDDQYRLSLDIQRLQEHLDALMAEARTVESAKDVSTNSAKTREVMEELYTREDVHAAIVELEEKIDSFSRLSKWMKGLDLRRYRTLTIYADDILDTVYGMRVDLPAHHWELLNAVVDATVAECKQKIAYIKANTKLY